MHNVCKGCLYNDLPNSLKTKFNALLNKSYFNNCPLPDDIYGCIRKYHMTIESFNDMCEFLKRNSLMTQEEEEFLDKKFGT